MKKLVLLFLTFLIAFSLFGCSEERSRDRDDDSDRDSSDTSGETLGDLIDDILGEEDEDSSDSPYNLPNQYKNIIYYFEQGFPDGWKLYGTENGKYNVPEEKLVIEIRNKKNPGDARYCVYKQKEHDAMPMTSTLRSIFALVTNPEHELFFNNNMGVRDDFEFTSTDPIDVILNGFQYYSSTYTFTKDGEDWQGQLFMLPHSRQYYVIAYEATVEEWEKYLPDFEEMMDDFRPTGFDSAQGVY